MGRRIVRRSVVFSVFLLGGFSLLTAFIGKEVRLYKISLGKKLFFDPILSSDRTISCASCHKPAFAFSDSSATSLGVHNRKGKRNTPSSMNLSLQNFFFWDGRAKSLEEQALAPIANPDEMNLPIDRALIRLRNNTSYRAAFRNIYHRDPASADLADAIAAFERTLETSDSPFDNWKFDNREDAVSESVKKGFIVFNGKGKCIECHFGADFTKNEFRNIGLFNGINLNDSGRAVISNSPEDLGKFKIPSLRNIAVTAPYMHNGMLKSLREVIDFYNEPAKIVPDALNRDSLLVKPLGLDAQEKLDLEAFLNSLTDKKFKQTN